MDELFFCPTCMANIKPENGRCPVCSADLNVENAPHQLSVNSILYGRSLVGKALGAGGFGITYIGYDLKLNSKVAVKEFYMSGGVSRTDSLTVAPTDKTFEAPFNKGKERFLDEAKILAQFIDEPNIVNVRDFFEENGTAYIVMEYLDGEDLNHYLKKHGAQDFDSTMAMLEPAMLALDKVHKKGLIHRDISPSNIMLLKDGSVKVLDFGTARTQSVFGEKSLSIMLKPGYAPEEQYRTHGQQGPWTDVYAMSATFYRLLTGKTPPTSTDRMFNDTIELPSALGVRITPQQEAALMRGLAVRSADRIQTMEELVKCLKGEQKIKKLRKATPWKKIAAAAAVLAVIGGGIIAVAGGGGSKIAAFVSGTAAESGKAESEAGAKTDDKSSDEPDGEYVLEDKYMLVKKTVRDARGKLLYTEEYEYNEYGGRTRYFYQYYVDGAPSHSSEIKMGYDENNILIYQESEYQGISRYEYEYDEDGRVTKRYEYDENHNLKGWDEYERPDGVKGQDVYTYYPDGTLEGFYKSRYDEAERTSVYEDYDADGKLSYKSITKTDENGNIVSSKMYSDGENLSREEAYTYDSEGRMISGSETTYYSEEPQKNTITGKSELMQIYVWHYFDEE